MKRPGRIVVRSGLALLAVLLIGVGGGLFWLSGSRPQIDGEIALDGLIATVEVRRDRHGIPFIRAENAADAYFSLGFLHAQDRLWQMDVERRVGQGRLSELFGEATLATDRFMRTLGLYHLAEGSVAKYSAATRDALQAYTNGVNAFLEQTDNPLPPEFQLLGYRPEPWRPADSLVWGRLMALQLADNWRDELLRAELAKTLSDTQIEALWPKDAKPAPVTVSRLASLYADLRPASLLKAWPEVARPLSASNEWVLDGSRTASGKPILANDPHLGLKAPGVWYLARIDTPGLSLAGVTAPGVPFHVLGHNGRIAWGFTTTHSDSQDFFIERIDPDDPSRYLTPDGSAPFVIRDEVIGVRNSSDVTLKVRVTRHGPVLSDAHDGAAKAAAAGHVLAFAAAALDENDLTPQALHRINQAHDRTELVEALRDFHAPQQNIVYADIDGNIGFYAPARIPVRRQGNGLAPVPGWTGEYDWAGFIPFEDLPHSLNPQGGQIVNANNQLVDDEYPWFLTGHWRAPYRAQRIEELLASREKLSLADNTTIQGDIVSLAARELLPHLLANSTTKDTAMLAQWDGAMGRDRPEPLIFYAWLRELERLIFADELGAAFEDWRDVRPRVLIRVLTEDTSWCDNTTTDRVETCPALLDEALTTAMTLLRARHGGDPGDWRWGDDHAVSFRHPILRRFALLNRLVGTRLATDGGDFTVNRGSAAIYDEKTPFAHIQGPSMRAIYDLGALDDSRFMSVPGQSDNPFSAHFNDLAEPWRRLETITLPAQPSAERIRARLILAPRP